MSNKWIVNLSLSERKWFLSPFFISFFFHYICSTTSRSFKWVLGKENLDVIPHLNIDICMKWWSRSTLDDHEHYICSLWLHQAKSFIPVISKLKHIRYIAFKSYSLNLRWPIILEYLIWTITTSKKKWNPTTFQDFKVTNKIKMRIISEKIAG